jgi:hypothetical protein
MWCKKPLSLLEDTCMLAYRRIAAQNGLAQPKVVGAFQNSPQSPWELHPVFDCGLFIATLPCIWINSPKCMSRNWKTAEYDWRSGGQSDDDHVNWWIPVIHDHRNIFTTITCVTRHCPDCVSVYCMYCVYCVRGSTLAYIMHRRRKTRRCNSTTETAVSSAWKTAIVVNHANGWVDYSRRYAATSATFPHEKCWAFMKLMKWKQFPSQSFFFDSFD